MNTFSWKKAFGFGVLIWLIMFAIISALVGFNVVVGTWLSLGVAIVSGITAYIFSRYLNSPSPSQAFGYGVMWVLVSLTLDLVISYQFEKGIFSSWQLWTGYALVLLAPWIEVETHQSHMAT